MIEEYCLVPKGIIKSLISKENEIFIKEKNISQQPFVSSEDYKPSLSIQLNKLFKTKDKKEKALSLYSWIIDNVEGIEYLPSGELLSPMKGINLLDFIKDVHSSVKTFPKEILDKYKVFSSLIKLPNYLIDNDQIGTYLYPHNGGLNKPTKSGEKRKISFINPKNKKKKAKVSNGSENEDEETMTSKAVTRSSSKRPQNILEGHGILASTKSPRINWIAYK